MLTVFKEKKVVQKTPIIELNAVHGLSELRDDQQTSGSGAITENASEFRVQHTGSGDFARLTSASRGRYHPGTIGQIGIGVRWDTLPTSGDFRGIWGYFEMNTSNTETVENGAFFGHDKDGTFIKVVRGGSEEAKVYAKDWNMRDDSGFNLVDGNIFEIDYLYYGYGPIVFKYIESNATEDREEKILHIHSTTGKTTMENTNLQVGSLVESTNTDTDFSIFVGGRQYNIWGKYSPRRRVNTARNTGVSVGTSGFTPIVSVQKESSRREIASDLQSFNALTDQDLVLQVRVNADLTGASFGALDEQSDSESGLQQDTSATAIDTGTGVKIYETLVSGGGGNKTELSGVSDLPVDVPDEGIITLCASAIDSSATVDGILQVQEVF